MNTKKHDSKRPLALALAPFLLLISPTTALAESSDDPEADPAAPASTEPAPDRSVRVFPRVSLFAPLSADPRWPKFTVAYSYYFGDSQFTHVGSAEAGASIAIVQKDTRRSHSWEIGLQAGIFAIFDFGAPSTDLVNGTWITQDILSGQTGGSATNVNLPANLSANGKLYIRVEVEE